MARADQRDDRTVTRADPLYVAAIVPGANLRRVPCTPVDAYLFSLVDGTATTSDLALATNLSLVEVHERLNALVRHGVVRWISASPAGTDAGAAAHNSAPERHRRDQTGSGYALGRDAFEQGETTRTTPRVQVARESSHAVGTKPTAARVKAQEISRAQPAVRPQSPSATEAKSKVTAPDCTVDEMEALLGQALSHARDSAEKRARAARAEVRRADIPFVLPEGRRKQIDDFHARIDALNFYERLDVSPGASRKQIRASYGRLAKLYHPDRLFRKDIGAYKPKIEHIFARLSEACETLSRSAQRDAYDASLRQLGLPVPVREATVPVSAPERDTRHAAQAFEPPVQSGVLARAPLAEPFVRTPEVPAQDDDRITMDLDESCALAAERSGQWALAAAAWRRLAKRKPKDTQARCRYVRALLQLEDGDLDDAQATLQEAFLSTRNDPELRLTLAALYVHRGLAMNAELELGAAERLQARASEVSRLRMQLAALKKRPAQDKAARVESPARGRRS